MSDKPIAVEAKPKVPVVEEFESYSRTEVQLQLEATYATLNALRSCLSHYCKGRGIPFKPKEIPVRDMIVRSSD